MEQEPQLSPEHVNPEGLLKWPMLSHVVIAPPGRLAFIAGQSAHDRDGRLIGDRDLYAQSVKALQNLRVALAAAGAKPSDILTSTVYIAELNLDRATAFVEALGMAPDDGPLPPHAINLVGVSSFPAAGQLIEIAAVAAIPSPG